MEQDGHLEQMHSGDVSEPRVFISDGANTWIGIACKETGSRSRESVKEKWGQLTDDDLDTINGRREQLEGKIQQRYGMAKDQVRKDVDDWYASQRW